MSIFNDIQTKANDLTEHIWILVAIIIVAVACIIISAMIKPYMRRKKDNKVTIFTDDDIKVIFGDDTKA